MNFITCTSCGLISSPGDSACQRCGLPLRAISAVPSSGTRWPPPEVAPPPQYAVPAAKRSRTPLAIIGSVILMLAAGAAGRYAYMNLRSSRLEGTGTVAWQKVTPPGGGYEVMLPGPMNGAQQPMATPMGNITAYMYSTEISGQGSTMVSNADYPLEARVPIDGSDLVDRAAKGTVTSSKSTLVSKREIQLAGGHRGVEIEMTPPKDTDAEVCVARIYWVRPRIYIMMVAGKRDSQLWKERDTFLSSLTLKR